MKLLSMSTLTTALISCIDGAHVVHHTNSSSDNSHNLLNWESLLAIIGFCSGIIIFVIACKCGIFDFECCDKHLCSEDSTCCCCSCNGSEHSHP
jgi:hypothetical protein